MDFHNTQARLKIDLEHFHKFGRLVNKTAIDKHIKSMTTLLFEHILRKVVVNHRVVTCNEINRIISKIQDYQYKNGGRFLFTSELQKIFKESGIV